MQSIVKFFASLLLALLIQIIPTPSSSLADTNQFRFLKNDISRLPAAPTYLCGDLRYNEDFGIKEKKSEYGLTDTNKRTI